MELVKHLPLYVHGGPKHVKEYCFTSGAFPSDLTATRASTGTFFNRNGLVQSASVNSPRNDYYPASLLSRGFLVEEGRTNHALNSGFSNITVYNVSTVSSSVVSPEGSASGCTATETTATGQHFVYTTGTTSYTAGTTYCFSVFAKAGTNTILQLSGVGNVFTSRYANFNLNTGQITLTSGVANSGMHYVGNGWYRCWVALAADYSLTSHSSPIFLFVNNNETASYGLSYAGTGRSMYLWGAQTERGAFPTSYIPTTSSAVTRAAEVGYTTDLSWFNSNQGTIFCEYELARGPTPANTGVVMISDGSVNNFIRLYVDASGAPSYVNRVSGAVQAGPLFDVVQPFSVVKQALSFDSSVFIGAVNGVAKSMSVSALPQGLNRINIGGYVTGTEQLNGWVRSLKFWPRALSSTELQRITT